MTVLDVERAALAVAGGVGSTGVVLFIVVAIVAAGVPLEDERGRDRIRLALWVIAALYLVSAIAGGIGASCAIWRSSL